MASSRRSLAIVLAGAVALTLGWILIAVRVQEAALSSPDSVELALMPKARATSESYPDAAAARKAQLFTRERLPDIMPDDARYVWKRHDLETGAIWLCFASVSGLEPVRGKLTGVGARSIPVPAGERWWPATVGLPESEAYEVPRAQGSSAFVGLSNSTRTVCVVRKSGS